MRTENKVRHTHVTAGQPAGGFWIGASVREIERVSLISGSGSNLSAWQSIARNTEGNSSCTRTALQPMQTKPLESVREKRSQTNSMRK